MTEFATIQAPERRRREVDPKAAELFALADIKTALTNAASVLSASGVDIPGTSRSELRRTIRQVDRALVHVGSLREQAEARSYPNSYGMRAYRCPKCRESVPRVCPCGFDPDHVESER